MIDYMTETPEHPSETTATAEPPSRWDKSHRRGGPFRLAAFVGLLAAIVFIIAVIFWSGFVLGSEGGDEGGDHHGDGGGGSSQEKGDSPQDNGSPQNNGMTHYGQPMGQTVLSVAVA
jgi:hypothetical protein